MNGTRDHKVCGNFVDIRRGGYRVIGGAGGVRLCCSISIPWIFLMLVALDSDHKQWSGKWQQNVKYHTEGFSRFRRF